MILETLLGVAAVGSALIAGVAMTTKEENRIVKPTTINNINNSINNSFNKHIETTKTSTSSVKKNETTKQSSEIDHDKIIDELYMRYKIDKSIEELDELLEKLNNIK